MPGNPMIVLSPDNTIVAIPVAGETGLDIWLQDLTRHTFSRFTSGGANSAVWSPDSERLLIARYDGKRLVKPVDGSGEEKLLFQMPSCPLCFPYDWSSDGKWLAFSERAVETQMDIWLVSTEGDRKPFPYLQSRFDENWARFSPDGHWMAYLSTESGTPQVYVASVPAGGAQRQISSERADWPQWRGDGKELFYRQGTKMMAVPIRLTETSVEAGKPQVLFESQDDIRFQVSRDGQRFLLSFPAGGVTEDPGITVVTNWRSGLKQ
jgi:Tol biopolymer transport system component